MKNTLETYALITVGAMLQGTATAIFLFPNNIPSGGVGGIALLLHYWFSIPLSFALWLVNFSMLVVAAHWLGNASAIGTMYSISVAAFSIYLLEEWLHFPPGNTVVNLIAGSVILGTGVGILLRQGVSNGGMGVLALIYSRYRNTSPGKPLFAINGSIFLLTASVIDWKIIFLAVISQWLSTQVVDIIHVLQIPPATKIKHLAWRKK
ncbi:Uncharacterised 5xTM membrane BCR, YitT family COG1284 [Evansella caseinilytica]|uniref:Uncharacterized 5xTM membrane BCR, YitT family COG1284 n=1 Tax=Evansella caseinilytica TaxID=1503961 RepID=A0A1H3NYK5_9BACI|nr:YitT family protein [Evansella caseinilytica]SDY93964.1 Uncharacterised 5xTM membrane BCR, YitT family COG1284 [Evansella caseinilytica]